jgi:membrane-bound lytic murein transglycosylase B
MHAHDPPTLPPSCVNLSIARVTVGAVLASFLALFSVCAPAATSPLRPEIESFIDEMARKHGYAVATLRRLFAQVQPRPSILRAMAAPRTARPWYEFREGAITSARIEGGIRFWKENQAVLEQANREFGVPEELIVATIGIETSYGRMMGTIKVLDALTTLAFDYPPRAEFFRGELEEFLLLAREAKLDAANIRGSYAGALGFPQFLPSSYRKYAIDFDGDGRRDLLASRADAIGSVANYYRTFGWKAGGSVIAEAQSGEAELGPLLAAGIKPHSTVAELRGKGLLIPGAADETAQATVFSVETENGHKLYLGFDNFYVITRYNRSVNYAMAVWELASELKVAITSDR